MIEAMIALESNPDVCWHAWHCGGLARSSERNAPFSACCSVTGSLRTDALT